jgi:hypothetical protein
MAGKHAARRTLGDLLEELGAYLESLEARARDWADRFEESLTNRAGL